MRQRWRLARRTTRAVVVVVLSDDVRTCSRASTQSSRRPNELIYRHIHSHTHARTQTTNAAAEGTRRRNGGVLFHYFFRFCYLCERRRFYERSTDDCGTARALKAKHAVSDRRESELVREAIPGCLHAGGPFLSSDTPANTEVREVSLTDVNDTQSDSVRRTAGQKFPIKTNQFPGPAYAEL